MAPLGYIDFTATTISVGGVRWRLWTWIALQCKRRGWERAARFCAWRCVGLLGLKIKR
jgi:hypothetical protein